MRLFTKTVLAALIAAAMLTGVARAQAPVSTANTVIDDWALASPPPAPPIKAVRLDAKKSVLFIADFNKKTCTPEARPRCAAALPKIRAFLTTARANGVLVVHFRNTQMSVDDLAIAPAAGELLFQAPIDKFHGNDVANVLKTRGIDTIVLSGTSANGAVLFTAGEAAVLGFKLVVPVDGMPADSLYQEQFTAWDLANGPTVRDATTLTRWDMIGF